MAENKKTLMFLESYSNYFNRIIKPYYLLTSEYAYAQGQNQYHFLNAINFNPNDGVNTNHIVNWAFDWFPDYMVVADENNEVESRWFVTEMTRTRGQQYQVSLKRDVINDYRNQVESATTFIEKGTLNPSDPLILNSEGMTFNQIKQSEMLLKDKSNVAWIVGYVAKGYAIDEEQTISGNAEFDTTTSDILRNFGITFDDNHEATIVSNAGFKIGFYANWKLQNIRDEKYRYLFDTTSNVERFNFYTNRVNTKQTSPVENNAITFDYNPEENETFIDMYGARVQQASSLKTSLQQAGFTTFNQEDLVALNGKIVRDSEDVNWRLTIEPVRTNRRTNYYSSGNIYITMNSIINNSIVDYNDSYGENKAIRNLQYAFSVEVEETTFKLSLEKVNTGNITFTIPGDREKIFDAPYDMFAIPYGKINVQGDGFDTFETSKDIAQMLATGLPQEVGSGVLYDLQLLPYCPIPDIIINGNINLTNQTEHFNYELIKEDDLPVQVMLWCKYSNFNVAIDMFIPVTDTKVENECDMFRLCSPNYQGIFEFNLAKNGGISYINVDCTYKPYSPYIHVNPNFGRLYGGDFGDARGLICGGDFSVAQTSDAFRQYEISNKNYQNIFDRGIKNMEVNRKYQRFDDVASAIGGTAQAAIIGGMAGGMAGAIAGGVSSAVAGTADVIIKEGMYKEQKSYQTDLYNYQLGNIRAMPDSLTKSSAFTFNNKLFPFLEYWTCTEEEKEAFRQKLKYNGMTVGAIRNLGDFVGGEFNPQFIQGQIIRLENISEDTHMLNAIFDEIKKGVFM